MRKKILHILSLVLVLQGKAQTITIFAGSLASTGFSGDGGPATAAQFQTVTGLAIDKKGDLFIADNGNNRIRKVNHNTGIITTIAGNSFGYSGDGGPATAANIGGPTGICFDKKNNLYIADGNNHIRKVDSAGIITTVAGFGTAGYSGDGGLATAAKLNGPWSITTDANGSFYIGDQWNGRIRKVDNNAIITTIHHGSHADSINTYLDEKIISYIDGYIYSGTGTIRDTLDNLIGTTNALGGNIIKDKAGNLYGFGIFDNSVARVDKYGNRAVVAGDSSLIKPCGYGNGGLAPSAFLYAVYAIAIDTLGNLYMAEYACNVIRKVNLCGSPNTNYTLTPSGTPQAWDVNPNYSFMATDAKWSWGDGTYTMGFYPSHTYTVAGHYNICVTTYNLCGDSSVYCQNDSIYRVNSSFIYINIKNPNANSSVNISQLTAINNKLQIYPNPTSLVLQVTGLRKQDVVKVYDVLGNEIKPVMTRTKENTSAIDVSPLLNGVYFIQVGTITEKFIIQH
jgi:hypothetical protein